MGAKEGASPADVVQQCDITFSCVSDSNAVRDVSDVYALLVCGMLSKLSPCDVLLSDYDDVNISRVRCEKTLQLNVLLGFWK